MFGLLGFQLGDAESAVQRIGKATQLKPGYAAAYNDLGNVLSELSRLAEAEAAYRQAIGCSPEESKFHSNLGSLLGQQGRPQDALSCYERALALNSTDADVRCNFARALRDCGRFDEAAETFRNVLDAHPERQDIYRQLCGVLNRAGRREEGYQGPQILAAALGSRFDRRHGELDVLDAGCGTGLCAAVLRPYAKSLIGVDLSEEMLARAAKRDLYDELIAAELTGFLSSHPQRYDLIVASDTFNYFGDLGPLLQSAAQALRPSGTLVFTAEQGGDDGVCRFQLDTTGRYHHTREYLETVLGTSRFTVESLSTVELRREAGQPVKAILVQAVLGAHGRVASAHDQRRHGPTT